MPRPLTPSAPLRDQRNAFLYRSLSRTLREYNRRLVAGLHARGFPDFSPAFPALLSNVDLAGTPIGVAAQRAGVTRQAAGQLLRAIERCGYARGQRDPDDGRVVVIRFTPRGRRMLATVLELVAEIEDEFAQSLSPGEFQRTRQNLRMIADAIDPNGQLGIGDAAT